MLVRPRLVALALVLGGLSLVPAPGNADCADPSLAIGSAEFRPSVKAGEQTDVSGRAFLAGCAAAVEHGVLGCDDAPEVRPLTDVDLTLEQDGRTWDLGTADASGSAGTISWSLTLPDGVEPGDARLVAARADLPITVTR